MSTDKILRDRAATSASGFTMLELLSIILVIGILSAIVAPAWQMFINNQRLKVSIDRAYWAMVTARSNAKRDKTAWQASFREVGETVQVAVHKSDITPAQVPASEWKNLEPEIKLHTNDTTLLKINDRNEPRDSGTIRRAMFNYQGCPVYKSDNECGLTSLEAQGTLTLSHHRLTNSNRCVIISTLLGHKRISQRQPTANNRGRFCY